MSHMTERFPKPQTSPRVCLKCDKLFPSTGPENRICKRCSVNPHLPARCEAQGALMFGNENMLVPDRSSP